MLNSEFKRTVRQRVIRACAVMAFILIPTFFVTGWSARVMTQNDKEQQAKINAYNAIYEREIKKLYPELQELRGPK